MKKSLLIWMLLFGCATAEGELKLVAKALANIAEAGRVAEGVERLIGLLPKQQAFDSKLFADPGQGLPFDLTLEMGSTGLPGQRWDSDPSRITTYDHIGVAKLEGYDVICFQQQESPQSLLSPLFPKGNLSHFRVLVKPPTGHYSWENLNTCVENTVEYKLKRAKGAPHPIKMGLVAPVDSGGVTQKPTNIYPAIVRQLDTWVPAYWIEGSPYAVYVTADLSCQQVPPMAWHLPDGTLTYDRQKGEDCRMDRSFASSARVKQTRRSNRSALSRRTLGKRANVL